MGINPTNSIVYSHEPRLEVYCLRLNFKISKLVYYTTTQEIFCTNFIRAQTHEEFSGPIEFQNEKVTTNFCASTMCFDWSSKRQLWSDLDKWTLAFLTFMMNFLKVSLSICHSFRSTGQSGPIKGFKRCLQVLQCSRRQQKGYYAARLTLMTSVLGRNEIKRHQSHLEKKEPFEGVTEFHLGEIDQFRYIKIHTGHPGLGE